MSNKAIVWIREDFRIRDNPALADASQQHDLVTALYIFNPKVFIKKREAQQWWLSKSLENFKTELSKININLFCNSPKRGKYLKRGVVFFSHFLKFI